MTQYCSCYLLFSRHWNLHTTEKPGKFWQLPEHWHFWEMALLKGEGHSIYILKAPMYQDLPESSTYVVFSRIQILAVAIAIWWNQSQNTNLYTVGKPTKLKLARVVVWVSEEINLMNNWMISWRKELINETVNDLASMQDGHHHPQDEDSHIVSPIWSTNIHMMVTRHPQDGHYCPQDGHPPSPGW